MNAPRLTNSSHKKSNLSLRNRLWLMQGGLVAVLIIGTVMIVFTTNIPQILNIGPYKNIRQVLDSESSILQQRFSLMFINTLDLAQKINSNLNSSMNQSGLSTKDLKSHPEIIGELLENQVELTTNVMEKTGCSGIYLILDATINPSLPIPGTVRLASISKILTPTFFLFRIINITCTEARQQSPVNSVCIWIRNGS